MGSEQRMDGLIGPPCKQLLTLEWGRGGAGRLAKAYSSIAGERQWGSGKGGGSGGAEKWV